MAKEQIIEAITDRLNQSKPEMYDEYVKDKGSFFNNVANPVVKCAIYEFEEKLQSLFDLKSNINNLPDVNSVVAFAKGIGLGEYTAGIKLAIGICKKLAENKEAKQDIAQKPSDIATRRIKETEL